jgi:hypothetical protein
MATYFCGEVMKRYLFIMLLLSGCGKDGTNGLDGKSVQGPAGSNGTVITTVQFCPGTSSYPSTFPELGLCINNNLYAVYSANDGFLTLIPPGSYNSNAIGSSCTFTVLPNCSISH